MSSGGIERDDDIKLVNSTVLFYQTLNMYFPDGTKFNSQLFLKVFFSKSIHLPRTKTKMNTFA